MASKQREEAERSAASGASEVEDGDEDEDAKAADGFRGSDCPVKQRPSYGHLGRARRRCESESRGRLLLGPAAVSKPKRWFLSAHRFPDRLLRSPRIVVRR